MAKFITINILICLIFILSYIDLSPYLSINHLGSDIIYMELVSGQELRTQSLKTAPLPTLDTNSKSRLSAVLLTGNKLEGPVTSSSDSIIF